MAIKISPSWFPDESRHFLIASLLLAIAKQQLKIPAEITAPKRIQADTGHSSDL